MTNKIVFKIEHYETIDSTSSEIRRRINEARAEEGLVVTASHQTAGRGRTGKSFESASEQGLYLSVLLDPAGIEINQISRLTSWVATACCKAISQELDIQVHIKWVNDLIADDKKLGGILCEYVPYTDREGACHNYVIIGIGINVLQDAGDFSPGISELATSLKLLGVSNFSIDALLKLILGAISQMYQDFPEKESEYYKIYKNNCISIGREVYILRNGKKEKAFSRCLNPDYSLNVVFEDGHTEDICSGMVSIRGLEGYI